MKDYPTPEEVVTFRRKHGISQGTLAKFGRCSISVVQAAEYGFTKKTRTVKLAMMRYLEWKNAGNGNNEGEAK